MDQQGMKNGELPEYPILGPFGGIQSELPTEMIAQLGGFSDALNIMFRLGKARVRPAFISYGGGTGIPPVPNLVIWSNPLLAATAWDAAPAGATWANADSYWAGLTEPWIGIFDFFTAQDERVQVANTPTQMYYYVGGEWNRLFGPQNGISTSVMSYAVVGQKLYFSQGIDPIWMWDGAAVGPVPAYVNQANNLLNAPAANYLFELGNHLVACNLITQGSHAYQRIQWSGAGDGQDWTSFDSGQDDLYNDLGPITGCIKLFQYGFIFQQAGINQLSLTGNAAAPFDIQPLSARSKGLVIPRSLAANGESTCYYVGQDNVNSFDGTTSVPIGDTPFQGRARLGARTLIFSDISLVDPYSVFAYVSTSVNGNPYNAYWLFIPGIAIWVYHIDDMTWTRWSTAGKPNCVNEFILDSDLRWIDMKLAWDQYSPTTSWESLDNPNPFPSVAVGNIDGSLFLFDFSGWSEQPWSLTTGEMDYGDPRHENSTKKLRLTYKDNGEVGMQVVFTNESGGTCVNSPTFPLLTTLPGTGSGQTQKIVLPVNLPSIYITMELSGEAGVPFEMSSYAPIYSQSGEVKNAL